MMDDKVWVLNPDTSDDQLVWLAGEIETKETLVNESFRLTIKAAKGRRVETIEVASDAQGEVGSVQRRNEEGQVVEDLIRLTHLHEPAILHALVERFHGELIYTYTGPVLIAVNPFQPLDLYTDDILESYYEGGIVRSQGFEVAPMPPHVYAVAADAYQDMSLRLARARSARLPRGVVLGEDAVSQSILISGESGSGKTVSTKHCLEYLTTVGQAAGDRSKGLKLAAMQRDIDSNKIVQSNPILEAFGNARTLRNDNSSRFGKLVQIHFDGVGEILGGGISSYLLEKVRLVKQSPGERNFHIFYQLCATASTSNSHSTRQPPARPGAVRGANLAKGTSRSTPSPHRSDSPEVDQWGLKHAKAYLFSNQGGVFVIRDVSDAKGLEEVRHAMATLEFADEEVMNTLKVAASVLHLGEISFAEDSGYGSVVESDWSQSSARSFCELTGVDYTALVAALTTKDVSTKLETVVKPLRPIDAVEARDALAKALYSRLFDWLVAKINISLGVSDPRAIQASINCLDIFGFEAFDQNSLEQLCINYTNEKLQQHFNNYVFKLEEEEYTREGIEWSFIDFPDNQDILDLIEGKKPLGILTLLDDECNNPSGSDKNFTHRIYKAFLGDEMDDFAASSKMRRSSSGGERITSPSFGFLGDKSADGVNEKHPRFDATRLMKPRGKFSIVHYAGSVTYSAEGFWSKNRDEFPSAARELLQRSKNVFVEQLFEDDDGDGETGRTFRTLEFGAEDSAGAPPRMRRAASAPEHVEVTSPRNGKQPLKTVAKKFQAQLVDLMARLSATQPHYIRCLKPNDGAEPFVFNQRRVAEQLRYGGVLEAVRVSRSGFPVRMPHGDFYYRYRRLVSGRTLVGNGHNGRAAELPLSINGDSAPEVVEDLTRMLTLRLLESSTASHEETYKAETVQFGKTKVFLRKEAHDALEARVVSSRLRAATRLQATARRILSMKAYHMKTTAIRLLQRCLRGYRGRTIAKHAKLCLKSAVTVQSIFRGHQARSAVKVIRMNRAVLKIQKVCRGRPTRRVFVRLRMAMIFVQCAVRSKRAVATRKRLAAEANSLRALQRKNDELVAKLAKQKDEEEEAKRGAEKATLEDAKVKAFAEAEAARQQRVDRTLKRIVVRFKHSVPLASAIQTWARATKMAGAVAEETKLQSLRLEAELKSLEDSLKSAKKKEQAVLVLGAWAQKRKVGNLHHGWMRMRLFVATEQTKMERERAAQATKEGSARADELAAQVESLRNESKSLEAQSATAESELKFAAWELRKKVKVLEGDAALAESTRKAEQSAAELKQEGLMAELGSSESRAVGLEKNLQVERSGRESERTAHAGEIDEYQVVTAQLKATEVELASEMKKCIQLESQALEAKTLWELGDTRAKDTERELRAKVFELEDALKEEQEFRLVDQAQAGEAVDSLKAMLKESADKLSREKAERASDHGASLENLQKLSLEGSSRMHELEESLATERAGRAEVERFRMADQALAGEAVDSLKAVLKESEDKLSREKAERASDHDASLENLQKLTLEGSSRIHGLEESLATERAGRADVEKFRTADQAQADEAIDSLKATLKDSEETLSREKAERASDYEALLEKVVEANLKASERIDELEESLATEKVGRAEAEKFRTADQSQADEAIVSLKETLKDSEENLFREKTQRASDHDALLEKMENSSREMSARIQGLEELLATERTGRAEVEELRTADKAQADEAIDSVKAALTGSEESLFREKAQRALDYEALLEKMDNSSREASERIQGVEESLATEKAGRVEVEELRTADKAQANEAIDSVKAALTDSEETLSREKAERALDYEALLEKMENSSREASERMQGLEESLATERAGRVEVEELRTADKAQADEAIDSVKAALAESEESLFREKAERASDYEALLENLQIASREASERIQGLEESLATERADRVEVEETHHQAEKTHSEELDGLRVFLSDEGAKAQGLIDSLQIELQAKNDELEAEKEDHRSEYAAAIAKAKSASDDASETSEALEQSLEKEKREKAVIEEELDRRLEHSRLAAQLADETIQELTGRLEASKLNLASEKEARAATEKQMMASTEHELELALGALSKEKTERSSEHAALLKQAQFASEEAATRIRELEASLNNETNARSDLSEETEKLNAEVHTLNSEKLALEANISGLTSQLTSSQSALSLESASAKAAGNESTAFIQELTSKVVSVETAASSEAEARASAERETARISEEYEAMKPHFAATESELRVERMGRAADHSAHLMEAENTEIALQNMMSHVKALEAKVSSERAEQEEEAARARCVSQEWEGKCYSFERALDKEKLERASERGDDQELIDYLRNEIEEVKRDLYKEQEDLKVVHQEATERAQYIRTVSEEAAKRIQELEDALELEETEKADLAVELHQKINLEQGLSFKLDELENALVQEKTLRAAADQNANAVVDSMRGAVEGLEDRLAKDQEDKALWLDEAKGASAVAARRIQELEDSLEEGEYRRVEFELEGQHKEEDLVELREKLVKAEAELNATRAAAAAHAAAAEDPAVAAAKVKALEDALAAAQAARQVDQADAAATAEQLAQALRALRDEALLEGNQVPELTARAKDLGDALAKERAGRGDDAEAHLAAHAAVEARSKHATDELRSQVGALMEAMAKERTVRAKQRGELDAKAATAASTVDALKAKVLSLEQALETERDKFKTAQAGASTIRERLEERLGALKDGPTRAAHSEAAATAALEAQLARALSLSPPSSPGRKRSQSIVFAAAARSPGGPPPAATTWLGPAPPLQLNEPPAARPDASPARQLVERLKETPPGTPPGSASPTRRPREPPPSSPRGPAPTPRHMPQTPPGEPDVGAPVIGLAGKGYQV